MKVWHQKVGISLLILKYGSISILLLSLRYWLLNLIIAVDHVFHTQFIWPGGDEEVLYLARVDISTVTTLVLVQVLPAGGYGG